MTLARIALHAVAVAVIAGLAALALSGPAVAGPSARPGVYEIIGAYDADTVRVRDPDAHPNLRAETVRLAGLDTPELSWRAGCPGEAAAGARALDRLLALIEAHRGADGVAWLTLYDVRREKYGRLLGAGFLRGVDLAAVLISEGHGRPYDGGKRGPWPACEAAP